VRQGARQVSVFDVEVQIGVLATTDRLQEIREVILVLAAAAQGALADTPIATPATSALTTSGRNPTWERAQAVISEKAARKVEESLYRVDSKLDSQIDATLSNRLKLAALN